jgi:hypothetical protein
VLALSDVAISTAGVAQICSDVDEKRCGFHNIELEPTDSGTRIFLVTVSILFYLAKFENNCICCLVNSVCNEYCNPLCLWIVNLHVIVLKTAAIHSQRITVS